MSKIGQRPRNGYFTSLGVAGYPFQRIHVDFAGPFLEKNFFLIVDTYSKWMEVIPMSRTTIEATIQALRDLFARYGIPKILVSDNGPQFTSVEFKEFLIRMG